MTETQRMTTEIKDFIISQKTDNPRLGCRALSLLIMEKFNKRISKSAINVLIKRKGLSSNVGRPAKTKDSKTRIPYDIDCAGAFFLKGIDEQLSLSLILKQFSRNAFLRSNSKVLEHKNSVAMYASVFHPAGIEDLDSYKGKGLWRIDSQKARISKPIILEYLSKIDKLDILPNIIKGIDIGIEEVHFLAIHTQKGETFYIDPTCHLIWLKPEAVMAYNLPIIRAQKLLQEVFFHNKPLILSSLAQGPSAYDLAVFFSAFEAIDNINAISLLGAKLEELYRIDKIPARKRDFIFAVLPSQINDLGSIVDKTGQLRIKFDLTSEEFVLESGQLHLKQVIKDKEIVLRLIEIKTTTGQPRLSLVTNIPVSEKPDTDVAVSYLYRWPNLEETFQDISKKIEIRDSLKFQKEPENAEDLPINYNSLISNKLGSKAPSGQLSFQKFLLNSLEYLNSLCQLRFFKAPSKSLLSLSQMRERFYSLSGAILDSDKQRIVYIYYPTINYEYREDLIYACSRFNEDNIHIKHKRIFLMPKAR